MIRALRRDHFDLILVETTAAEHEDRSAYSWLNCRTGESTPVVMLSENATSAQVAAALEAGVDDIMRRSVDPAVLVARLHAVLRRCNRSNTRRVIEMKGYTLDRDTCMFLDRGTPVMLTPREFMMAWLFFSSPGIYLSRDTISVAICYSPSPLLPKYLDLNQEDSETGGRETHPQHRRIPAVATALS
ncbi:hypothetical protein AYR66_17070 [Noviherbaspirillum denitrificans]|uniref:Response regulatory domain-containing protein n=2 Tax=Noviherbaspirillum denitrificans TaxID=1968433 RepID=A0A254TE92_9BURK|nr:hypothetical protein AYR66_17070 [Noviherbaspirillum denitrificans]